MMTLLAIVTQLKTIRHHQESKTLYVYTKNSFQDVVRIQAGVIGPGAENGSDNNL